MSDDNCLDASVPASVISQLDKKSASYKNLAVKFGSNKVEEKLRKKINSVPIKLFRCHNLGGNQSWKYNFETRQIVHMNSGLCLDKPIIARDPTLPVLNICDSKSTSQTWILNSNFKWQIDKQQNNSNSGKQNNDSNDVDM